MNQKGLSSLLLLIMIVLGVFIIWESNEFFNRYSTIDREEDLPAADTASGAPLCITGETSDCNDSNDVFILE